jgi:hypothetical protein
VLGRRVGGGLKDRGCDCLLMKLEKCNLRFFAKVGKRQIDRWEKEGEESMKVVL